MFDALATEDPLADRKLLDEYAKASFGTRAQSVAKHLPQADAGAVIAELEALFNASLADGSVASVKFWERREEAERRLRKHLQN